MSFLSIRPGGAGNKQNGGYYVMADSTTQKIELEYLGGGLVIFEGMSDLAAFYGIASFSFDQNGDEQIVLSEASATSEGIMGVAIGDTASKFCIHVDGSGDLAFINNTGDSSKVIYYLFYNADLEDPATP